MIAFSSLSLWFFFAFFSSTADAYDYLGDIPKILVKPIVTLESCWNGSSSHADCSTLLKQNCHEYYLAGARVDGEYYLGEDNSEVFCTFTDGVGITYVRHNFMADTVVRDVNMSRTAYVVSYSLKPKDIEQLIEYSQECSQEITFKCVQQGNVTNEGTVFRWSKTDFLKSVSDKNFKDPENLLKNLCLTEKETIVILKDYQSPIDTVAFSKDPPGHSRRILLSLGPLKCSGISKSFDVYANGSWDGNIKSFSFRFLLSSQNHRLWQLRTTDSHRLWRLTVNIERGNVIVFRIESDFSFPTRSHHFLVSPRLLSDAHWHTFAFEVREIGLVAITLDDRTYKLDLITFAESTILIIGDEYQYTLYLPRSNERHRDSRYLKMSVGHICFKNLQVNHQEVSPKKDMVTTRECGVQPMFNCAEDKCLNQVCPCVLQSNNFTCPKDQLKWYSYKPIVRIPPVSDAMIAKSDPSKDEEDYKRRFTDWDEATFSFKTTRGGGSQLLWNFNSRFDYVVQVEVHQGSTVRLIVCKLTKIGDSHTIERYERLTDGNHCRFCSVSKVAEYHDGSPIPVSIIRHTADNYTLKVEGKACQVQEETLTLFFGSEVAVPVKTIGHSYWILGGIPYHNEFLSGALKAESTYFQDFYMPTTKVFVGLTTDLVVDGKAIGFAQEFKTAVDGDLNVMAHCICGGNGICQLPLDETDCKCSPKFVVTTPENICQENRTELIFLDQIGARFGGIVSIASLPLGQENEMTGVSSSDLFSMVKLRTVIVPKRSYTKCAEQILLILKFQDPVMEYRLTLSVKKEPNKATLLVAVSTNEGYAVKKHEFSYQIQPDSDNFVHLNLMIMNNTLDVRVNGRQEHVVLEHFNPARLLWELGEIEVGSVSQNSAFVGAIRSMIITSMTHELNVLELLEPCTGCQLQKFHSTKPLQLGKLTRSRPSASKGFKLPQYPAQVTSFPDPEDESSIIIIILIVLVSLLILLLLLICLCLTWKKRNRRRKKHPRVKQPSRVNETNPPKEETRILRKLEDSEVIQRPGSPMRRRDQPRLPAPLAHWCEDFGEFELLNAK